MDYLVNGTAGRKARLLWGLAFLLVLAATLAGCQGSSGGEEVRLVITPVATPTATPLTPPTVAPTTYTVRSGDTLSGIAALFGVSVDDIVRVNNIADPNTLSEGQVLTIPGRSASQETPTEAGGAAGTGTPAPPPVTHAPPARRNASPLGRPLLPRRAKIRARQFRFRPPPSLDIGHPALVYSNHGRLTAVKNPTLRRHLLSIRR